MMLPTLKPNQGRGRKRPLARTAICALVVWVAVCLPRVCLGFEATYRVQEKTGDVLVEAFTGSGERRKPEGGVRVLVGGKEYGRTNAEGRLTVRWLEEGEHGLEIIKGDEVVTGTLQIPRIIKARFVEHWFEDKSGKRLDAFGLKQDVFFVTMIQNTGTTRIDSWELKDTCPGLTTCSDVKITTPPLPVWLTKPVIAALFKDIRIATAYSIKGGTLETANAFQNRLNKPNRAFVIGKVPEGGLKPGETITVVQPWSYWGFFQPQMLENLAIDKGLKGGSAAIRYQAKDPVRGVIEGSIKEYTIMGITRHNVGFEATYRGLEDCCTLWLIVDGKPMDSRSLQACYRLGKGFDRD